MRKKREVISHGSSIDCVEGLLCALDKGCVTPLEQVAAPHYSQEALARMLWALSSLGAEFLKALDDAGKKGAENLPKEGKLAMDIMLKHIHVPVIGVLPRMNMAFFAAESLPRHA